MMSSADADTTAAATAARTTDLDSRYLAATVANLVALTDKISPTGDPDVGLVVFPTVAYYGAESSVNLCIDLLSTLDWPHHGVVDQGDPVKKGFPAEFLALQMSMVTLSPEHLQLVGWRHQFLGGIHVQYPFDQVGSGRNGLAPVIHLLPLAGQCQRLARFQGFADHSAQDDLPTLPMPDVLAIGGRDYEVVGRYTAHGGPGRVRR